MSHESERVVEGYDPELPFLRTLEGEVRRSAERAARGPLQPRTHQTRARPDRVIAPRPSRVARRTLILVALFCLIGASAFGASEALRSARSNPTELQRGSFVRTAIGVAGAESWTLRAYRLGAELCQVLVVGETEDSRCAPQPAVDGLTVASLLSPQHRYLFGAVGAAVTSVTVRAGGASRSIATHAVDPAVAHAAALPQGARYFATALPRPESGPEPPAEVQGLDRARHRLGQALTICADAGETLRCSG